MPPRPTRRRKSVSDQHALRASIENWQRVGPILQQIRDDELRRMTAALERMREEVSRRHPDAPTIRPKRRGNRPAK